MRERDDPVGVHADENQDEPGDAPEHEARGGGEVVVEGGEGARGQPGKQLKCGREQHPGQGVRGRVAGDSAPAAREHVGDRPGGEHSDEQQRQRE